MDKKTILQLISHFDIPQLQDLVLYIVNRNQSAQQSLLDYCQKNDDNKDTKKHDLIIEHQLKQHWLKASKTIEKFDMYGGGPESEEDDAYCELDEMEALLEDHEVSWKIRKEITDDMLGFVASDNSGFTDRLMDIVFMMCTSDEEKFYLADYLSEHGGFYYGRIAAKLYLEVGQEESFLKSKKAKLKYASDYLELADYYKKRGDEKQAYEVVQEGFQKADGNLDEIYEYLFQYYKNNKDEKALEKLYKDSVKKRYSYARITELMHQYYKEKGDYEKQKGTLLKLVSCCDDNRLDKVYGQCRQELTETDFSKEEKGILSAIKNRSLSIYFDILLEKGETREVMDYILQHPQFGSWGLDRDHCFSKKLVGEYPREVTELYWKEASYYVGLGKEQNYARAAGVLKEIRKIMKANKWSEEWSARYTAFVEQHRKKRLLLKVLEGIKE